MRWFIGTPRRAAKVSVTEGEQKNEVLDQNPGSQQQNQYNGYADFENGGNK